MWANIAMGCLVVAAAGTAVTIGFLNWNSIETNGVFSELLKSAESFAQTQEMFIALEPESKQLTEDDHKYTPYKSSSTATTNDDITFGQKYGKLLVEDKLSDSDWWDNNFKKQKEHIKEVESSIFSGMKKATPEPSNLKEKCQEAYNKKIKDINEKDIENIWLLCSPMKHAPHPITATRRIYEGKFGSTDQYKAYFLEDRPSNKNAWEIIYDKFAKDTQETKSKEFEKVKKGYEKTPTEKDSISLNKFCGDAYSKGKSELEEAANKDYKSNVLKFCTFTTSDLTTLKPQNDSKTS